MKPSQWLYAALLPLLCVELSAANWPSWRGPLGTGVCSEKNLPTRWSSTNNVKWRTPLPEPGNSTPVIWNDRVFITQAQGKRRTVMCFNKSDGTLHWQSGVDTADKEPTHSTNPFASASPVTDGERVIASFASDGLYCYDLQGREVWRRTDLGRQIHIWGNGASPTIHGDLCYLNFGPGETTYLIAVDKRTGKTVWKHDERIGYVHPDKGEGDGKTSYIGSWTTPVIMDVDGKIQLLMTWPRRLVAYEPATGKEVWTCGGINPLVYTSPIYENGIVVAMGGFNGISMAVRAGGSGDVTETHRLWMHPKTKQRIGSGVIHDGHVYVHNDPGIAECFDLKTGKLIWEERLRGKSATGVNWSSIMLADGLCYSINQGGDCFVFKASSKFELLSANPLGDRSNSSIAASGGNLFIRTHNALWCIGN